MTGEKVIFQFMSYNIGRQERVPPAAQSVRGIRKGESSWSLMDGEIRAEGKVVLPKGALKKPSDRASVSTESRS